jgi:alpha/beta superfamily hydrolase
VEHVQLTTTDGHHLEADLAEADGNPAGAVVICHPHPLRGGDRFNAVVEAMFVAFAASGFHALRFDFRAEHGEGVAERLDVVAALGHLADRYPGVALHTAGYSFGAVVSLNVADDRIVRKVAVAPPLSHMDVDPPRQPTLVLVAEHDQFCPPSAARPIVATWPDATIEIIASADHFLAGRTMAAAETAAAWLSRA